MADYTQEVLLPSHKANIYPDHPEYSGPITIRMMRVDDEKKVFGATSDDSLDNLIKACVVSPENFNPQDLIPNDRHFLLVKIRILSYGDTYHGILMCDECGYTDEDYKFSLDDVNINELEESFEEPFTIDLPISKKTVGLKVLRQRDVKTILSKAKKIAKSTSASAKEIEFVQRLVKKIVTIDGEKVTSAEAEKFVNSMMALDRATIDSVFESQKLGYESFCSVECPKCGEEVHVPFRLHSEFFRPRIDN